MGQSLSFVQPIRPGHWITVENLSLSEYETEVIEKCIITNLSHDSSF